MKPLNEMFIGLALTVFLTMVSLSAYGDTVINYDDGSTYTLAEQEKIYITRGKLFTQKNYSNGNVHFTLQKEHTKRDYVPDEDGTDDWAVGSHEWCKAYVPWHEGLTFDMISWQRSCDTNRDGKYGCGDKQFDESADGAYCS
jgi:hypothetical protein